MKYFFCLISLALFICCTPMTVAEASNESPDKKLAPQYRQTDLPLPRFVSLRADKVHARTGPARKYPIKWVYKKKNLPVEIIQEFDGWRKVRDRDGEEGWIHQSLLSGRRFVIIENPGQSGADPGQDGTVLIRKKDEDDSLFIARFEQGVIAALEECSDKRCLIESGGYSGWIGRKFIWGIYEKENIH